jgi:multiple sugar transport system permease protein
MGKRGTRIFIYLILAVVAAIILLPVYWMVIASVRTPNDLYSKSLIPSEITLSNYIEIFSNKPLRQFHIYIRNSLIVALSVMCICIVVASLAGYSLVFISYRGKDVFSSFILFGYVFPGFILMVPIYTIFLSLNLINTYYGLILADLIGAIPFSTWMLRGYMMGIPKDLIDSAMVDGCGHLSALFRVVLPVTAPGLVTVAIFSFVGSWDSLLFPLLLITTEDMLTLPIGIMRFAFGEAYHWGPLMAAAVICTLPPAILYSLVQKYLVKGLLAGAVKG